MLEADGTVSSAVIALGEVEIKPNANTTFEMIDGQFSRLEAGDCTVKYDPWARELAVCIEMKHIRVRVGDDGFEGNSEDCFVGKVSLDAKQWHTTWVSIFDYGERFPMDPNAAGEPLTFTKVQSQ